MSRENKYYKPNTLMSIHGYNSNGDWQDSLSTVLSTVGIKAAPFKYGRRWFRVLPYHIAKIVDGFRDYYFTVMDSQQYQLDISEPYHRPSIIAHSLGTLILVKAITKYPEIKFDKIFLVGSIVPYEFDWYKIILNDQASYIVYEKAKKDGVVDFSFVFSGSFQPSGKYGFLQATSSFLRETIFENFGHSDFDYKNHFHKYIQPKLLELPHQLKVIEGGSVELNVLAKIFKESSEIDKIVYDKDYNDTPIKMETVLEWAKIEPNIWSFVKHVFYGRILGYINAVPVDDKIYEDFIQGKIKENELKVEHILDYASTKEYNLIILSIAIDKSEKIDETSICRGKIAEMLIMSFIEKIERFRDAGSILKKIAAFAWTSEGKRLSQGFGMNCISKDVQNHEVYSLDMNKLREINMNKLNFMARWWYKKLIAHRYSNS